MKKLNEAVDDLVSRPDPKAAQGEDKSIRAAVAAHGMTTVHARGKRILEITNGAATNVLTTTQHIQDGVIQLRTKIGELFCKVE